ncbi:hypothetical protein EJ02DRAFT_514911 [Clathrospora elynae]|uniref:Uncharacterized protein n=1 Tax=Clathrospora elynae TaxID=706981 RepID=A0A6A5SCZ6_9PLEO|nr:hypothetical protein EJ02DRAFT_514911 [Clathrospora elynae]
MTLSESNSLFQNPWHWLAQLNVMLADDSRDLPVAFTEIWDVVVSFVNGEITTLSNTKSNGSVAGITSGVSLPSFGWNHTTPDDFIAVYEMSISKALALPLVVHTVPAPPDLVQRRVTKIITKLPAIALWLLVTSNLFFALFGLVLSVLAIRATSPEVHQIHTRLTTAGLAAQLFDWQHARRAAKNDQELFTENLNNGSKKGVEKRISVRATATGGAEFLTENVLSTVTSLEDEEQVLFLRSTQKL